MTLQYLPSGELSLFLNYLLAAYVATLLHLLNKRNLKVVNLNLSSRILLAELQKERVLNLFWINFSNQCPESDHRIYRSSLWWESNFNISHLCIHISTIFSASAC
ncbi:hypothetical protein ACOME3_009200 [Neoechinorhynchus agilis]